MKIGLIDCDSHNFPNLPLMKLSAWHKAKGDTVTWYDHFQGHFDKVYVAKVFSFSEDYREYIDADDVVRGGSGYAISLINGKEVYSKQNDKDLPFDVEHIYPDYSLYPNLTKDTAYGFLSRGCHRGCSFCHVKTKEGGMAYKVADLTEFWSGQRNIVLCDPNIMACRDWKDLLTQCKDSGAWIDFNQGIDIRLMTEEKAELFSKIKMHERHFAWDRYQDKEIVLPRFKMLRQMVKTDHSKMTVFVLVNYDSTFEQDVERVELLKDIGYSAYVMIYNKENADRKYRELARYTNSKFIYFRTSWNEYTTKKKEKVDDKQLSLF